MNNDIKPEELSFAIFLDFIKVLRMLYGKQIALDVFDKNIELYYDVNSKCIKQPVKAKDNI